MCLLGAGQPDQPKLKSIKLCLRDCSSDVGKQPQGRTGVVQTYYHGPCPSSQHLQEHLLKCAPCVSPHFCTEALCATVPDEKPGTVKPGLSVIIPPLNSRRQRSGYTASGVALHSSSSRVFESEPTATDRRNVRQSKAPSGAEWSLGLWTIGGFQGEASHIDEALITSCPADPTPVRSGREKITAKWVWMPGFFAHPLQHS